MVLETKLLPEEFTIGWDNRQIGSISFFWVIELGRKNPIFYRYENLNT